MVSPSPSSRRRAPRVLLRLAGRLAPGWLFCRGHRWRLRGPGAPKVPLLLSFDVDTEDDLAATPALLAGLRARGLTASFACVGQWVKRRPAEHRRILADGHEILNHGYAIHTADGTLESTRFYDKLNPDEVDRDIRAGHEVIQETLEVTPRGFRAPHFATLGRAHLKNVYETLRALGYRYSSSTALGTIGNGTPFVQEGLVELPVMSCPDHPTSTFDTWHLWTVPRCPHAPGDIARLGAWILREVRTPGGPSWINVYFDPVMVDRAGGELEGFLSLVAAASHVEVLTLGAFAARWANGQATRP